MKNLDDKLIQILQTPHLDSLGATVMSFPTAKTLAQIKQAFEDEGYHKNKFVSEGDATILIYPCMTGREWYDRFRAEVDTLHKDMGGGSYLWDDTPLMEAARKAAGL